MELSPLLIGLEGTRASAASVRLLKDTGAAGVLLLARNIRSPAQVRDLVRGLREGAGRPLLFSVDHEGGWVLRFASGLTAFPGNAALGRVGDPALAHAVGARMGRELRALGIGLNLAPVLDLQGPRYNPGIGIRSFGADPKLAGLLGAEFIRGLNVHKVAGCAKHFPGKGEARVDAHVDLPVIPTPRERMERVHMSPFRAAIRAGVPCVMSSHAIWPALHRGVPATYSNRIVHGTLYGLLRFGGAIISDDLCMGAVARHLPVPEAAVAAMNAGHHLLIVAHAPELMRETAARLQAARACGEITPKRWWLALRRVERLLARYALPPAGPLPKPDRALAARIARGAVAVLRAGRVPLPLPLAGRPRVAVYWPDFRQVQERFTFEGGPAAPLARLRRRLRSWPARARVLRVPITAGPPPAPDPAADIHLFFCFEALRFPGQRAMLEALRPRGDRLVAVLLRSVHDRELLGPKTTVLTAYGYRDCQLDALLDRLEK